jgi:hypothetical protein
MKKLHLPTKYLVDKRVSPPQIFLLNTILAALGVKGYQMVSKTLPNGSKNYDYLLIVFMGWL